MNIIITAFAIGAILLFLVNIEEVVIWVKNNVLARWTK